MSTPHHNLLAAGPEATRLPVDPAAELLVDGDAIAVAAEHPTSSLAWAELAEDALSIGSREGDVTAYAYARTGYHRGLDALRRSGWRGSGPVPWEHEPNQGFLRALWSLAQAAARLGESDEQQRCEQFLRDSSETAWTALTS